MSDSGDDEQMVTKPFKFVTGMFIRRRMINRGCTDSSSWYVTRKHLSNSLDELYNVLHRVNREELGWEKATRS